MDFSNLEATFIFREFIVLLAIIFCLKGNYHIGNRDNVGWMWMIVGGVFWAIFAIMVKSPMSIINNFIYIYLAIRGWHLWKSNEEKK
jgi:uncharacterized membrane protein HdeD (DUF308 family)